MWMTLQILVFDTKIPVVPQYEHIFGDEETQPDCPGKSGTAACVFSSSTVR